MFRAGVFLVFVLLLVGCDSFRPEEDLVRERVWSTMNRSDWDSVDGFPLFDTCSEQESAEAMRTCFEQTLLVYLSTAISDLSYEVEGNMNEEVSAVFLIDRDGFINLVGIETSPVVDRMIPTLKEDLQTSFSRLFQSREAITVSPAHKRGISVGMRVKLPILLRT